MGMSVVLESGKMGVQTALIAIALSGTLTAGQNQWTAVGPEGGSVLHLAAESGNLSTVYAATCAGVFKTADRGVSWSAVNSGLPETSDCSGILAVDPQNAGTVYAVRDKEIFKTTDGGAHWSAISALDATNSLQVLVIDPSNSNTLYTGATEVFKSTDGGVTWGPAVIPIHSCCLHMLAVDPHNSNTIYAAYGAGFGGAMSKSTDGGATWSPADSGLSWIDVFVIDPRNSDTLYASAGGRIFKSTDGGASWISLSFRLPPASEPTVRDSALCLAVNPQNPGLIYAVVNRFSDAPGVGPKSVFYLVTSTDAGESWTTATDPILAVADLVTIMPDPQDTSTLYLGTTNGVLKSTDGGAHWNFTNSGLRGAPIGQVAIDSQTAGTMFAVARRERNSWHGVALLKSTDGGDSWFPSSFGLPWGAAGLVADGQSPRTLYIRGPHNGGAGAFFGTGVFKSEDAGGSWAEIWSIPTSGTSLGPLAISTQAPNIIYSGVSPAQCCNSSVARSVDAGRTWTQPQAALTTGENIWAIAVVISAVAVDPRNPDIVYAGTTDSGGYGLGGLSRSVDGGVSWRNLADGAVDALLMDPLNPDTIYASGYSSSGGWSLSTDGGENWTGLRIPCRAYLAPLTIDPQDSGILYCGDDAKVFRSADAGANWTEVGLGLRGRVASLTFAPQDPATLYAVTSSGLFAITLRPAVVSKRPRR